MNVVEDHVAAAKNAIARRDWQAALEHWDAVADDTPDRVDGHVGKGQALLQLGRLDEAEAVLAETMPRFPAHVWVAVHYGDIAARRRDWPEALRRYDAVCEQFPQNPAGPLNKAVALRELGRRTEAEALLLDAAERFPANAWLASTFADLASRRGDWASAVERFRLVRERFPEHAFGYLGLMNALQRLNRLDEADDVIAVASEKFSDHHLVIQAYASSAARRTDWIEAVRRWDWMVSRFPGDQQALGGKAEALIQLGRLDEAEAVCFALDRDHAVFRHVHSLLAKQRQEPGMTVERATAAPAFVEPKSEPAQPHEPEPNGQFPQPRQRVRRNSFFRRGRY